MHTILVFARGWYGLPDTLLGLDLTPRFSTRNTTSPRALMLRLERLFDRYGSSIDSGGAPRPLKSAEEAVAYAVYELALERPRFSSLTMFAPTSITIDTDSTGGGAYVLAPGIAFILPCVPAPGELVMDAASLGDIFSLIAQPQRHSPTGNTIARSLTDSAVLRGAEVWDNGRARLKNRSYWTRIGRGRPELQGSICEEASEWWPATDISSHARSGQPRNGSDVEFSWTSCRR